MKISLPKRPIHLYEVEVYLISNDEIKVMRYVYHVLSRWDDLYPNDKGGIDFQGEWQFFNEHGSFERRHSGWRWLSKQNFHDAFPSEPEAKKALLANLNAILARQQSLSERIKQKISALDVSDLETTAPVSSSVGKLKGRDVTSCPFCGGVTLSILVLHQRFRTKCSTCNAEGPDRPTTEEAIDAWNRGNS